MYSHTYMYCNIHILTPLYMYSWQVSHTFSHTIGMKVRYSYSYRCIHALMLTNVQWCICTHESYHTHALIVVVWRCSYLSMYIIPILSYSWWYRYSYRAYIHVYLSFYVWRYLQSYMYYTFEKYSTVHIVKFLKSLETVPLIDKSAL